MKEKQTLNTSTKLKQILQSEEHGVIGLHGKFKEKDENIMLGVQGELQINRYRVMYSELGYGKIFTKEDSII